MTKEFEEMCEMYGLTLGTEQAGLMWQCENCVERLDDDGYDEYDEIVVSPEWEKYVESSNSKKVIEMEKALIEKQLDEARRRKSLLDDEIKQLKLKNSNFSNKDPLSKVLILGNYLL